MNTERKRRTTKSGPRRASEASRQSPSSSPVPPSSFLLPPFFLGPDRWRPWLLGGLCALLVVRPLFPSESAASHGDGLLVVMLWIALAVCWALGMILGMIGRRAFFVRFGWTDAAVVLLVGWHTIAAVWAASQASPRPAVNMLWEWIAFGLC